jgi:hypothetical protein
LLFSGIFQSVAVGGGVIHPPKLSLTFGNIQLTSVSVGAGESSTETDTVVEADVEVDVDVDVDVEVDVEVEADVEVEPPPHDTSAKAKNPATINGGMSLCQAIYFSFIK